MKIEENISGYSICECGNGVFLHESGFELDTHMCSQCKCFVADKDEFFNVNLDVQILSK